MSGCRDCQTCTAPGAVKANRAMLIGMMHFFSIGMTLIASRAFLSHCPTCSHVMSRHQRRGDGSFID